MVATISTPPQALLGLPNTWSGAQAFQAPTLIGAGTPYTLPGTSTPLPYNFQVAITADPAQTETQDVYREAMIYTTLNYSAPTTNIWEGLCVFTIIGGTGSGTGGGEINGIHSNQQVSSGATVATGETYEGKIQNSGTLTQWEDYLAIVENETNGTIENVVGYTTYLTNANTTPGSVTDYTGYEFQGFSGAGALPTFMWAWRNQESRSMFSNAGTAIFGTSGPSNPAAVVQIQGPDTGTTYLLRLLNSGSTEVWSARDNGTLAMGAMPASTSYANDAAAATGGVAIGGLYRNGSIIQCRIS